MWRLIVLAALTFPGIEARDLAGRTVQTATVRGPVVYMLGFTYESRAEVEAWERELHTLAPGLRVITMPVYRGAAKLARGFIDNGMARKTPAAAQADVMTTVDDDALIAGLKLTDPERAVAVVLVDAAGQVALIVRGAPTAASRASLAAALKQLPATKPR